MKHRNINTFSLSITELMANTPENWIDDLADVQLPALSHYKKQLSVAIDRPATDYALLAHIISRDPGLLVRLYQQLAKSAGHLQESIGEPARIISLLGIEAVRKLIHKTPSLEDRYKGPALEGLKQCYGRATLAAALAHCLAVLRAKPHAEQDMIAGLLQNIGEMALWTRKPGTMGILSKASKQAEQLDLQSWSKFGLCLSDVGKSLAERWRLPESIANVQSFSNSFDSNSQLPLLAANLAWQAMRDSQAREMEVLISLCADLTHLDEDMVRSRLHQEMAAAARLACAAGLPYMADQFLLVAEDASKPLATAPAKQSNKPPAPPRPENPQTSEAAKALPKEPPAPIAPSTTQPDKKQTSPSADKPQQKPLAKPSTQAKSAATTAKAPRRPSSDKNASSTEKKAETTETSPPISPRPAKPSPAKQKQPASFQAILGQAMRNLHSEWRLERIMFAMLTVDRQQLRSRFVMEKTTSNLGQFSVPASSRNLFSLLIAKPYTLWVNKDNQAKYLPHIPESAASLLKGGDFFVSCVLVDEKPIGILYADGNGLALDDKQFDAFKKVMEQTQHALKKKN